MKIVSFLIDDKKRQIQGAIIKAENPCKCGCSTKPFVLISNGKYGLSAKFESKSELDKFKQQVNQLSTPTRNKTISKK